MPYLKEDDIDIKEMGTIRLRFRVEDRKRMFTVGERNSCVFSKNKR